jgi:hypothetical protein
MTDTLKWFRSLLFKHRSHEEIDLMIDRHKEQIKIAEKLLDQTIAALDGELDWLECECHEKLKKGQINDTLVNSQQH